MPFHWNYTRFAKPDAAPPEPDEIIDMTFTKQNAADGGFNLWAINGSVFSRADMDKLPSDGGMAPAHRLQRGKRYRLRMRNASDDIHPVHLHRDSFELTRVAGAVSAGVMEDVVMVGGYQEMEVDFTADNPGLTLFHCLQQLHMDYGFMLLFEYV
jgi:FtsP/CotA-like multicopper oxidase with cupredoxin domain